MCHNFARKYRYFKNNEWTGDKNQVIFFLTFSPLQRYTTHLACSAGVFIGRENVLLAKAPWWNSKREEEMGRVKRSGEGAGSQQGERRENQKRFVSKKRSTSVSLACSKRSDSGERCEVKKGMKSRGGLGREVRELPLSPLPLPRFYFFALLLLRTAPHYLNAWNRLQSQIHSKPNALYTRLKTRTFRCF